MMSGNVIRIKRLDVHGYAATRFEDPLTFFPYLQEFFEINIPFVGIVLRVLCIGMTEVIRGRRDDEINTALWYVSQNLPRIPANYSINKWIDL